MSTVNINGQNYTADPNSDESLMEQLRNQGVEIVAACNGAGICQTCAISVSEDDDAKLTPKTETEEMMGLPDGQRMSCQCKPSSNDADIHAELVY